MTPALARGRLALLLLAAAGAILLGAGCNRLLPARHGTTDSFELVIDTRQDPAENLSGAIIPEVFPAVTKWPVLFAKKKPASAAFTDVTCETIAQSGDPLSVLEPVIEGDQVFLKIAVPKADSVARVRIVVHARYRYRW
jgi:hypothetical protein